MASRQAKRPATSSGARNAETCRFLPVTPYSPCEIGVRRIVEELHQRADGSRAPASELRAVPEDSSPRAVTLQQMGDPQTRVIPARRRPPAVSGCRRRLVLFFLILPTA